MYYLTAIHLFTAVCDPPCVNGVCTKRDVCECLDGWTGDICDQRKLLALAVVNAVKTTKAFSSLFSSVLRDTKLLDFNTPEAFVPLLQNEIVSTELSCNLAIVCVFGHL